MQQQGFIAIELSPIDAEYFVLFQKYYKQFKYMADEGVFDVRGGSAIIDFNEAGEIDRIIRQLYSKKRTSVDKSFQENYN